METWKDLCLKKLCSLPPTLDKRFGPRCFQIWSWIWSRSYALTQLVSLIPGARNCGTGSVFVIISGFSAIYIHFVDLEIFFVINFEDQESANYFSSFGIFIAPAILLPCMKKIDRVKRAIFVHGFSLHKNKRHWVYVPLMNITRWEKSALVYLSSCIYMVVSVLTTTYQRTTVCEG